MNKKKKTGNKIRKSTGDKIFDVINAILFGLFALVCAYPFYYVIINSISINSKVLVGAIRFYPIGIHFENYIEFFQLDGIFRAAFNSVARTVLGVLAMLLSSTVLGYAMTKPEYWHRKFWYRFLIATMYFSAGVIPSFLNIKRLGLMDNFLVYIVPAFVSPYNMILIKTYIESIPQSLEEAAIMDGAGYFWRFTRVVIPLSKAVIATVAIFTAVSQWNAYMDTFMYMYGNENQTLQSMLYLYINKAELLAQYMQQNSGATVTEEMLNAVNPSAIRHTATTVTLLPILMVYPFFQKYFTKGVMIGAVKG